MSDFSVRTETEVLPCVYIETSDRWFHGYVPEITLAQMTAWKLQGRTMFETDYFVCNRTIYRPSAHGFSACVGRIIYGSVTSSKA